MQNNNWSSPFIRSISSFLSLIAQVDSPRIKLDYVCRTLKEIANNYLVKTVNKLVPLPFYGECLFYFNYYSEIETGRNDDETISKNQ